MRIVPIINILQGCVAIDSNITICGWVRTRRDSKSGISFLSVYDGSCFHSIQVIISSSLFNYKNDILRLTTGCSVTISGRVTISPGQNQDFEILAIDVKVIGWIENPDTYPIAAKRHSIKYLREIAHLRPRTNLIGAIVRVRHTLAQALHRFFHEQGYFWIPTPVITTSNAEGAGQMFRISTLDMENLPRTSIGKVDYEKDFFGKESFLSVSGQLNSEAYACALSKIYSFGPIFRAENSNTSRHASEFWMLESEVAFSNLDDIINLIEKMLKYVFIEILKKHADDMKFFIERVNKDVIDRLDRFVSSDLVQINYDDAVAILEKYAKKFKSPICWGIDFTSEHERFLTENYFKKPIVVKNYPKDIKAFYMRLNEDNRTVAAMDVLVPSVGEIIGGSQREERLDMLDLRMEDMKLDRKDYWWYRDLRRYGTVPHSGFGLGFDRLVSYITGVQNIRDIIPFPRTPRNAEF